MARQWRIEYEGALYHVLSRGNERRDIFSDEKDRHVFLETLGQLVNRFDLEVHAYALMGNHYHLLLRSKRANLSEGMQWLGTTYSRRYNVRHGRSGHLFQGRFKNIVVEDERYLLNLSCYIHRNPLRAGLVRRLVDYRWSSYPTYGYGKTHADWLTTDLILGQFKGKDRHRAYREKVQKYSGETGRIWEDVRHGLFLGSKEFIERIKGSYLIGKPHEEIPQQGLVKKDSDAAELLCKMATVLDCKVEEFRLSRRIGKGDKDKRDLMLYLLWETGRYKGYEIGDLLGLGYSSVSRRAIMTKERKDRDKALQRQYKQIKSLIKM